ncbi:Glycosyltransferase involved in cell wall bisynthesis [Bryocella elongata]|uniref:Glycosyltransferase involved in cell wall bisynthesis n=1 Tax=Bryocella elongata TaxID=863522 RepID=A0A1H5SPY4_9BACT|nr:glycosyltransferase [Bryocella elongata]SEF52673.1 Glycosyltransferase involved in cell wall bisynthesis [Bryocella elongata]
MHTAPTVLVYHNELLPFSATFIRTQAAALQRYQAAFAGIFPTRRDSLPLNLSKPPVLLTHDQSLPSRLRRRAYKEYGIGGRRFLRELARLEPALIHAHFALDAVTAMRIAHELQIPLVTTLHGYDVTIRDEQLAKDADGRIYLRQRDELYERTAHFFTSCDYIQQRARERGFPAAKMETLYSGHEMSKFDRPEVERNRNLIVYIGRLVEKKGCAYLLRAAASAAERCPDIELAIIGQGPLREELEALAKELGVRASFLGPLLNPEPGNDVIDWLARARLFCMPSITASDGNTEGQPAVFVEAHGMGTPAVSFATAGIGEAVLQGETGLLAPEKDIPALADAMVELLSNDELWSRFSARARTWTAERFDIRKLNVQLENAYERVLTAR